MPITDTSFLVALFNGDDPHHQEARARASETKLVIVPGVVLAEFLQVLRYRVQAAQGEKAGRSAARQAFQAIESNPTIVVQPDFDVRLASSIYHKSSQLSYVDAIGVAVAHRGSEPLLSFDRRQLAALKTVQSLTS